LPENGAPFNSVKGILFELGIPELVVVEDLGELVFHLDKDQLVLGHHVDSLCLQDCLLMFFFQSALLLHLPMQFFIQLFVVDLYLLIGVF
jgi:hypothetical protein